jgi:hypothetical protein
VLLPFTVYSVGQLIAKLLIRCLKRRDGVCWPRAIGPVFRIWMIMDFIMLEETNSCLSLYLEGPLHISLAEAGPQVTPDN